jgi:hypothetical protein
MMKVVNYFYLSPNKYHQIYRKGDSIRAVISSVEIVNNRLYVSFQELLINFENFRVRNSEVFDGLVLCQARKQGVPVESLW